MTWWGRKGSARTAGLRHGFRSGLEAKNAELLKAKGQEVRFEVVKIKYVVPLKVRTYSLDFELDNGIMVETKGLFEPIDRAKHLFIKTQHPELDIRFVFSNPSNKISKGSSTTYADWAEKYGFKWAAKVIPTEWLVETGPGAGGVRTIPVPDEIVAHFNSLEPLEVTERVGLFNRVRPKSASAGANEGKKSDLPLGVFHNRNRYRAQAKQDGKSINIGTYDTAKQASAAYKRWVREHVPEARLIIPVPRKKKNKSPRSA